MQPADLTDQIKAEAHRLGFSLVGVTTPDPPASYAHYAAWVDAGRHGPMDYLATERALKRRADPRHILPECRSILVLGLPYAHPGEPPPTDNPSGVGHLAAYAWGDDYHDVFEARLTALTAFIEERVGAPVPNRWYTDTGPILERDLASRAGLGWIGKNSMLIHPEHGSTFLIAEILLGIELQPDAPFTTDHCGSCTACIDACPTDCILPDRTIDANRCISTLTIELKTAIPLELREQTGSWVFGCDVCQQVCPWNVRFAPAHGDPATRPRAGLPQVTLVEEFALDAQAFNRKFKGSPVKRAKRRGYLRNVAVALGNRGDPAGVPALRGALHDPEPLVRQHAAWALGQIGGAEARQALQAALNNETDYDVIGEVRSALSALNAAP